MKPQAQKMLALSNELAPRPQVFLTSGRLGGELQIDTNNMAKKVLTHCGWWALSCPSPLAQFTLSAAQDNSHDLVRSETKRARG